MFSLGFARSPFRDFETYLRVVVGLDESDIHINIKQKNSNFITYEIPPGIYPVEDFSEIVYTMGDHEGTIQIEYDEISMKTKLISALFGRIFGKLGFDEKFFKYFIGFETILEYKPNNAVHAESLGVYILKMKF